MHKVKALGLVATLVIILTSAVMLYSYSASPRISADVIRGDQTMVQDIVNEKLLNAEASLLRQGRTLGGAEKVVNALSDIRATLLTTTPDELKKSNNKWNEDVFNSLLSWHDEFASEVSRAAGTRAKMERGENATATELYQIANWWKRAPDLLLAFVDIPLADGSRSSILAGYGAKDKMMRAGKRYDMDIDSLKRVQESNTTVIGLFPWDQKMYISATSPVMKDGVQIGQVVVGMELSRESLNTFMASIPEHLSLMMYYARTNGEKNSYRYISNTSDEEIQTLKLSNFRQYQDYNNSDAPTTRFEQVNDSNIYVGDVGGKLIAFSREKWMWNSGQETGFYIMSDMDSASRSWDAFRQKVLLTGLLALLIGLVGAYLFCMRFEKRLGSLKDALLESINSGAPLEPDVFSCLPGFEHVNIGKSVLKSIDDEASNEANADMSNMLSDLDLDDARNVSVAIPALTQADIELRELYETYIDKRHETGKDVDMPFDQFVRRINRNREKIEAAHPGAKVKFTVNVQNGKAVLTPSLVK